MDKRNKIRKKLDKHSIIGYTVNRDILSHNLWKRKTTMTKQTTLQLSNQALGAVMMALQNSLMNQTDIVPVLQGLEFVNTEDGLVVLNPPTVNTDLHVEDEEEGA